MGYDDDGIYMFFLCRPLYTQVVMNGNFTYLEDFLYYMPLDYTIWTELAKRVNTRKKMCTPISDDADSVMMQLKAETPPNKVYTSNFKKCLTYLEDRHLAYQLASDLGFDDVTGSLLASTVGLEYFTKTNLADITT